MSQLETTIEVVSEGLNGVIYSSCEYLPDTVEEEASRERRGLARPDHDDTSTWILSALELILGVETTHFGLICEFLQAVSLMQHSVVDYYRPPSTHILTAASTAASLGFWRTFSNSRLD